MIISWTILTTKGPAVGSATVSTLDGAAKEFLRQVPGIYGKSYSPEHAIGLRQLAAMIRTAGEPPFVYRAGGMSITVES